MLKVPCTQHATAEGPSTHYWENCYVMQEFRAKALKKGQRGDQGGRLEQFNTPGSQRNPFGGFPNPGPQGGSLSNTGQFQVQSQQLYNPQGVFQQPPPLGDPQRQDDNSGSQNNPKQLNSGQYHVFTTSTCKRGQ